LAHACNPSYSGGVDNRSIEVWSQPGQIVHETLPQKNHAHKRAGGVAEGIGPEFKL
jgi:hypothetical protein